MNGYRYRGKRERASTILCNAVLCFPTKASLFKLQAAATGTRRKGAALAVMTVVRVLLAKRKARFKRRLKKAVMAHKF